MLLQAPPRLIVPCCVSHALTERLTPAAEEALSLGVWPMQQGLSDALLIEASEVVLVEVVPLLEARDKPRFNVILHAFECVEGLLVEGLLSVAHLIELPQLALLELADLLPELLSVAHGFESLGQLLVLILLVQTRDAALQRVAVDPVLELVDLLVEAFLVHLDLVRVYDLPLQLLLLQVL